MNHIFNSIRSASASLRLCVKLLGLVSLLLAPCSLLSQQTTLLFDVGDNTLKRPTAAQFASANLAAIFQPLDADLTSWATVTRASGFDTFAATPSGANLASLLTSALPVTKGGTGAVNANVARANLGVDVTDTPTVANYLNVATWGDSLTSGSGGTPYQTPLATATGWTVYNGGVGGDTSTQIKTRLVADTTRQPYATIIWAGRNNYTDPTTVKADIATMVSTIGHQRYLILGVINGDYGGYERIGGAGYTFITQLNSDLAAIYGAHFIDIRSYLVSLHDNSAQDLQDFADDIVPTSLRSDTIHLNTTGYAAVATKIQFALAFLQGAYAPPLTPAGLRSSLSLGTFTSGRVPYATTGGALTDSAEFLFSGSILQVGTSTGTRILIGKGTDAGNGALQFATHTTGAGGIGFGNHQIYSPSTSALNFAIGGTDRVQFGNGAGSGGQITLARFDGGLSPIIAGSDITGAASGLSLRYPGGSKAAIDILSNAINFMTGASNTLRVSINSVGDLTLTSTTDSTTKDTGSIVTDGGLGAEKNITAGGAFIGGVQSLSGAGAVNVTTLTTEYTSTGAAQALSLANGSPGQIKIIVHGVDGGSGVLTPTTKTGYTTITFTNAGESATLQYFTTRGWIIIALYGAVAA